MLRSPETNKKPHLRRLGLPNWRTPQVTSSEARNLRFGLLSNHAPFATLIETQTLDNPVARPSTERLSFYSTIGD